MPRLLALVNKHKPEVVAVQEIHISHDTLDLMKRFGYEFSGHSYSFRHYFKRYSVATFFNPAKISVENATKLPLRIGFWDLVLFYKGGRRSVLTTTCVLGKKRVCIHNIHLSPYTTNNLREMQLDQICDPLTSTKDPHIVLGDFNYPYGRKKLEKLLKRHGLREASRNIFHTFRSTLRIWPFKFKLDYIVYKNIYHIRTVQIDSFAPDHTPILAKFRL